MTNQQAYFKGFCKVANAAGYSPAALYKQAARQAAKQAVRWSGSLIGDAVGRFTSLLFGSPAVRKPLKAQIKAQQAKIDRLKTRIKTNESAGRNMRPARALLRRFTKDLILGPKYDLAKETAKVWGARGLGLGAAGLYYNQFPE